MQIKIKINKFNKKFLFNSILLKFLFYYIIIPFSLSKEKTFVMRKLNLFSEMIVTIRGTGDSSFLWEYSYTKPNTASVQNYPNISCNVNTKKAYNLEKEINNVTLIWDSPPLNFYRLFFFLAHVTHVYFIEFDASKVETMQEMFYGCSSLKLISFNNINISSTNNMIKMFMSCTSLKSLDLSNLDTSKVTTMQEMFSGCTTLEFVNLTNLKTSSLEIMDKTFEGCESLKSLDLSDFDTSSVISMAYTFYGCRTLVSLNLTIFNTKSVKNMGGLFRDCQNLKYLDLSNFDTSSVTSMTGMFEGANSVISLDLSNFNTSYVESMENMFYECRSLKNVDLSNFDVRNVITMKSMFYDCNSITSLDLSSFVTTSVTIMRNLFYQCLSLISINLKNFDTRKVTDMSLMFYRCKNLIYLNLQSFDTSSVSEAHDIFTDIDKTSLIFCGDNSKLASISSEIKFTINCTNNCFKENIKLLVDKKQCTSSCSDDDTYKMEYNNICYQTCPDNTHVSSDNPSLCLDNVKCYSSCETCKEEGNINKHNCEECISDFRFINDTGKETNCYKKCEFYYYFKDDIYVCTSSNECLNDYNKLVEAKGKCINECTEDDIYKYEYNKKCYQKCPDDTYTSLDNNYLCLKRPDETDESEGFHPDKTDEREGFRPDKTDESKGFHSDKTDENKGFHSDKTDESKGFHSDKTDVSEGFYSDINNIFNPCYSSCKECNGEGNKKNHNCKSCLLNYKFLDEKDKKNNCYSDCGNYNYFFDDFGNYQCTTNENCPEKQNKFIQDKNKCIDNCTNDDTYKLEYNNKCYKICPDNSYLTFDNNYLCQKNPEGYYLDNNIYMPCYESCKSCKKKGDKNINNCDECINGYNFLLNPEKVKNCYKKCQYLYYFDNSNNYHCTINDECPKEQRKLIKEQNKCIDNCTKDEIYKFDNNNICEKIISNECPMNKPFEKNNICVERCTAYDFLQKDCKLNNKNNKTAQDSMILDIKSEIAKGNLNEIVNNVKEKKQDYIIDDKGITFQITSSANQNNKTYDNISTITLGECENKLKEHYKIDEEETLIIFKVDVHQEDLLIPLIEYEIYNPINLEKLNLSICYDTKIEISIPLNKDIDVNNLFKYNSSHEYYNDLCYSYTTDSGTDITLKDRQEEYKNNNYALCESDCIFTNFDSTNKKVSCECPPKLSLNSISDITENKGKLFDAFTDVKNIINLNIMKCYKKFFNKDGILKNAGSFILLSIASIQIVSFFIFKISGYSIIYQQVQQIIKSKIQNEKEMARKNKNEKYSINIYSNKNIKKKFKNKNKIKNHKKKYKTNISNPPYKKSYKKGKSKSTKKLKVNVDISIKANSKVEFKYSDHPLAQKKLSNKIALLNKCRNNNKKFTDNTRINFNKYINDMKISDYNDYELNSLLYEEAFEIDKRTYCQIYVSLLRQSHIIIFSFITSNDYNSRIIKISLFFFSIGLYLTINALFFNYSIMSKILEGKGKYNFILQIPQILYSTIICTVVNILTKTLSLSQKTIIEFKNEKDNILAKTPKLLKCLAIKFHLFFILSFLLVSLFWYYIGCFCAVYKNTQGHLVIDALISFGIALVYPLFLNIMPGIFRLLSLKDVNKSRECLYKFSQILQYIV